MTVKFTELRPGDVLLHASTSQVSRLIQWASDSDYSHIAMVYEPGLLAEAISAGVHFNADLQDRLKGIPEHFERIDAWRPTAAGDPISESALAALKASAKKLEKHPFALNQWFELGLVCAIKNKAPDNPILKWLITKAIETFVKVDPSRLLCSEFVYLSFFHAATEPPGLLKPKILRPDRKNRPFPKVNVLELIKEYLEAVKKASGEAGDHQEALVADSSGLLDSFAHLSAEEIEARWKDAREAAREAARKHRALPIEAPQAALNADPHPDLIEPQDFAESSSFRKLGSVTTV